MTPLAAPKTHAAAQTATSHVSAAPAPAFSPEEREQLDTEDKHAATAIIGIIVAIFVVALLMYAAICFVALGSQ